jgi:hypothetical protein
MGLMGRTDEEGEATMERGKKLRVSTFFVSFLFRFVLFFVVFSRAIQMEGCCGVGVFFL